MKKIPTGCPDPWCWIPTVMFFIIFLFLVNCSHAPSIIYNPDFMSISPIVGKNTQIGAFPDHSKDDVSIYGLHTDAGKFTSSYRGRYGLEFEVTKHEYRDSDFTALDLAFFGTYDLIDTDSWQLYVGGGLGLGYSPDIDDSYEMVGDNGGILGIFDYRVGIRFWPWLIFDNLPMSMFDLDVAIEYKHKHWSAPSYTDAGENDDLILIHFIYNF